MDSSLLDRLRHAEQESWPARFVLALIRRFIALEFFDRSLAIAAQLLVAFLPLLIAFTTLLADGTALADELVRRLGVSGPTASMVRLLFAGGDQVDRTSVAWIGSVFFLTLSLWLLGRRVRRLYERSLDAASASAGSAWRGLVWLLALAAYLIVPGAIRSVTVDGPGWIGVAVAALAVASGFAFFIWSPWFLLDGRVSWRSSATIGTATGLGMLGVAVWARVWLPTVVVDQAERYGAIGVSFALFSWLYALALALVGGAVVGAAIEDVRLRRQPALREFPV